VIRKSDLNYPVLIAESNDSSTVKVWCGYCAEYHYHSPAPGHRVAHCLNEQSPYLSTGYVITHSPTKRYREYLDEPSYRQHDLTSEQGFMQALETFTKAQGMEALGHVMERFHRRRTPFIDYQIDSKGIATVHIDMYECDFRLSSRGKAKLQAYINGHTMFGILYDYTFTKSQVTADSNHMNIRLPGNHARELIAQFKEIIKDNRNVIERGQREEVKHHVSVYMGA